MSNYTGAMIAFFLPASQARLLDNATSGAFDGNVFEKTPVGDLHLTLALLGDTGEIANQKEAVLEALREFARNAEIIHGTISGPERFDNVGQDGDKSAIYASFDSPALAEFQSSLVASLNSLGVSVASDYKFTPHITLAYTTGQVPTPQIKLPKIEITFETITVAWGDERISTRLQHEDSMDETQNQTETETNTQGRAAETGIKTILRAYGNIERAAGTDNRRITFCAYPYELDRHGTTIRPSAFLLDNYKKNPICSFAHDNYDELPVGKAVEVWVEQPGNANGRTPGLWCVIEFARHAFAEDVYQCYVGGFMNAVSVEADALDYELPGRDFDGQTGPTYTQVELIDISCVPVPGAANALAQRAMIGANGALIQMAWDRVQDHIKKSGREMSAKNMTALKGLHDKVAEMEGHCKTIRESLKSFLDQKQPGDVEKSLGTLQLEEISQLILASGYQASEIIPLLKSIIRDASTSNDQSEQRLSDPANTNPTREAATATDQGDASTSTNTSQGNSTAGGSFIDNWLEKLGWAS